MYQKPKISYNTVKRNTTLAGFIAKPEESAIIKEEEVEVKA